MKISLIILTKNEIQGTKAMVPKIPRESIDEIITIDGKSSDGTTQFLESQGIRVITQEKMGRGEAFRIAMEEASGDALIFFSPDGNEDPADIAKFRKFLDEGNDIVIASRMMKGARNEQDDEFFKLSKWVNQIFTLIANILWNRSGKYVTDTINGFRAVTKETWAKIKPDGSGYTIEYQSSIRAFKNRLKIAEFPTYEGNRIGPGGAPRWNTGVAFIKCLWKEILLSLKKS
jgi:glycosyltransferase involved in cell wall biosynthesis